MLLLVEVRGEFRSRWIVLDMRMPLLSPHAKVAGFETREEGEAWLAARQGR